MLVRRDGTDIVIRDPRSGAERRVPLGDLRPGFLAIDREAAYLRPHMPKNRATSALPVAYDENARAPPAVRDDVTV